MADRLRGKVIVVTGGASGIGLASVRLFLAEGAKVVVGDLAGAPTPDLPGAAAGSLFLRADVSREEDVKALLAAAVEHYGRVDVLFNNAGYGGTIGGVQDLDMAGVDRSIGVLLKGVLHGYKHATPIMSGQGGGSIISTASVAATVGGAAPLIYSVCKAAVVHLARCAAMELAPLGIRSNAICPGSIATPLLSRAFGLDKRQAGPFSEFLSARIDAGLVVPRVGRPDDVAELALFLASDASAFITGEAIAVDGGYSVNPALDLGQRAALAEARAAFASRPLR